MIRRAALSTTQAEEIPTAWHGRYVRAKATDQRIGFCYSLDAAVTVSLTGTGGASTAGLVESFAALSFMDGVCPRPGNGRKVYLNWICDGTTGHVEMVCSEARGG